MGLFWQMKSGLARQSRHRSFYPCIGQNINANYFQIGNPTSEGFLSPCKGKNIRAAGFISSGSKEILLCSAGEEVLGYIGSEVDIDKRIAQICNESRSTMLENFVDSAKEKTDSFPIRIQAFNGSYLFCSATVSR